MNKEEILQLILQETEIFDNDLNVPKTYVLYKNNSLNVVNATYEISDDIERLFVVYKHNGSIYIEEKF